MQIPVTLSLPAQISNILPQLADVIGTAEDTLFLPPGGGRIISNALGAAVLNISCPYAIVINHANTESGFIGIDPGGAVGYLTPDGQASEAWNRLYYGKTHLYILLNSSLGQLWVEYDLGDIQPPPP